jgi:Tol biopolymer transport system component
MPAVSPDGKLIAYASNRAGGSNLDIWVQQATGGAPIRVTDDPSDELTPDFSPDSSQIIFRGERDGGGVFIAPSLGGASRLIAREGRRPRFSPDGTRVAYWAGGWRGFADENSSAAYVISLGGGTPRLVLPQFAMVRDPVWSPDGQSLLVLGRSDRSSLLKESFDWWWVPLDGRPPVKTGVYASAKLLEARASPSVWTSSGVVFASEGDVWSVPISSVDGRSGTPRRLTVAAGASTPAASRDGTVVFAIAQRHRVVERAPIGAGSKPRHRCCCIVTIANSRSGQVRRPMDRRWCSRRGLMPIERSG